MHIARRIILVGLVAVLTPALLSGCAYFKDRGNDALDILDIGITFSAEPHVGIYGDFQSIATVGYADIEGKMLGVGNRRVGWLDMDYDCAGGGIEGRERWAYGDYEANPEINQEQGVGVGMLYHGVPRTAPKGLNCAKFAHLFFIGVNVNCKIGEVLDFVLGWTTLDIGLDDEHLHGNDPDTSSYWSDL